MAAAERDTQRLRELHEYYVWQVNAAVGEGRDDLVAELADQYLEDALAELTAASYRTDSGPLQSPRVHPIGELGTAAGAAEELTAGPAPSGRPWWRRLRRW